MATIREEDQFRRPVPQTLKAGDQRSRISRCSVCMRKPPERMLPLQEFLGDYDSDYANDQSYGKWNYGKVKILVLQNNLRPFNQKIF